MATTTIALSDAKAGLSALVQSVQDKGASYTITVRGMPAAVIAPLPPTSPKKLKAFGALAGKRPSATRDQEKAAFAAAMEARHG